MKNKIMRFCFSVLVTLLFLTLLCWTTHSNLFVKNTLCLWILGGIYLTSILYMFTLDYCIVISKEIGVLKTRLLK